VARLPQTGSDDGVWGDLLNEFLLVTHDTDGSIKSGSIQESHLSSAVQTKLNTVASGGNDVTSVAGRTGAVTLTKSDVGLANVDNTSDANKPVSTATQTALNLKADASAVGNKVVVYNSYADAPALPVNTVVISITGS